MLVVLIILSVGLLGLTIFFAISRSSTRPLKLAAFIAMGLIALSLVVGGIFLIAGTGETEEPIPFQMPGTPAQEAQTGNVVEVLVFLLLFFVIMALVIGLTIREQRRKNAAGKGAAEKTLKVYDR